MQRRIWKSPYASYCIAFVLILRCHPHKFVRTFEKWKLWCALLFAVLFAIIIESCGSWWYQGWSDLFISSCQLAVYPTCVVNSTPGLTIKLVTQTKWAGLRLLEDFILIFLNNFFGNKVQMILEGTFEADHSVSSCLPPVGLGVPKGSLYVTKPIRLSVVSKKEIIMLCLELGFDGEKGKKNNSVICIFKN